MLRHDIAYLQATCKIWSL